MSFYPYFIVGMIPLLLFFYDDELSLENFPNLNGLLILLFILFSGLRGNGNGDYFNYRNGVLAITSFSDVLNPVDYPFEIGFRIIAWINNLLGLDPQFTIFSMSVLSLTTIGFVINKYSENIALSWFIYIPFLLLFDMHHSRSGVSITFTVLTFHLLMFENKLVYSVITSLVALSFHRSAIIILLSYYIMYVLHKGNLLKSYLNKIPKYTGIVLIFVSLVLKSLFPLKTLISSVRIIFPDNTLLIKAWNYVNNDRWSYAFRLYDPRLWMLIFLYLLGVYYWKEEDRQFILYRRLILLAILTLVTLSDSTILAIRFYSYFNVYIVLFVPKLYTIVKKSHKNVTLLFVKRHMYVKFLFIFFMIMYVTYIGYLSFREVPYYLFDFFN